MDTDGRGILSNGRTVTFLLPLWPTGPVLQAEGKGPGADMVPAPRVICTGSGSGESLRVCVCMCVYFVCMYVCAHLCCVVCVVEGVCVCGGGAGCKPPVFVRL